MKVLSWNVQGFGGVEKRRKVKELIGRCDPDLVVLQETKKEVMHRNLVKWTVGPFVIKVDIYYCGGSIRGYSMYLESSLC